MATHYRTQGIVLKKNDRGEADQLFTIYTKDFGKLEILGKAIRKIKSKLRAGIDIFYLAEIEFIQGKAQKTLTEAFLIDKFENIRRSFKKLKIAYKISEVLDNLVFGQEPDKKIWQLLIGIFQELNNQKFFNPEFRTEGLQTKNYLLLYHYFLWHLSSLLGYKLELYHCSLCQKRLTGGTLFFNPKEGGIVCSQCQEPLKSIKEISPDIVKILRFLTEKDWLTIKRLKIETSHLESLKIISHLYYSYILGELAPKNILPRREF